MKKLIILSALLYSVTLFAQNNDKADIKNLKKRTTVSIDTSYSTGEKVVYKYLTTEEYNGAGNITRRTEYLNGVLYSRLNCWYDDAGLLVKRVKTDSSDSQTSVITESFAYDKQKNKTKEANKVEVFRAKPYYSATVYDYVNTYNQTDSLISVFTSMDGVLISKRIWSYGKYGRTKEVHMNIDKGMATDSSFMFYEYNAKGQLIKLKAGSEVIYTYYYDQKGSLNKIVQTNAYDVLSYDEEYKTGNRTDSALSYSNGKFDFGKKYIYNSKGLIETELYVSAIKEQSREYRKYFYDANGNLIKQFCWCDDNNETIKFYYKKDGEPFKKEIFKHDLLESTKTYEYEFY